MIGNLYQGGMAFITVEYAGTELPKFDRILSEFGMTIQMGYAVDTSAGNYYQKPIFLLPNVEYADETNGLTGAYTYLIAPYAQGIDVPDEEIEDITYTKLLNGSEISIVKTNITNASTYEKEEGDIEGPVCIGVKAEKTLDSGTSTIYLFASAQMFTDSIDNAVSGNNKQLFSNIMSTLANHETSVSVPVKSYEMDSLIVSASDLAVFGIIAVVILPLALLAAGLIIWLNRRSK